MSKAASLRIVMFLYGLLIFTGCSPKPEKKIEPDDAKKQIKALREDLRKEHGEK